MSNRRSARPQNAAAVSRITRMPILGLATSLSALMCLGACSSDDTFETQEDDASIRDAAITDADPALPDAATHNIGVLGPGLSTLIGDDAPGFVNGPREVALVNNPVNVVMGPNGSLFVADFDNGVVRQVTPEGVTTTLIEQAGFSRPFGMAVTPSGTLFVQTDRNSTGAATGALWKVAPGGSVASLELDNAGRVRGIASLSDGRLILANVFTHTLRIYNPATGSDSPLAGQSNTPGYANGTGEAARFNAPLDIVIGSGNQIFVADSQNHRIRRVTLGGAVTTIAGSGTQGSTNGTMLSASFDTPVGLALDGDTIFVSEFGSGKIRKAAAGSVTTIAGSTPGFADHSDPMLARLSVSEGLAFEAPYLYIADGNGGTDAPFHRVRRLDLSD